MNDLLSYVTGLNNWHAAVGLVILWLMETWIPSVQGRRKRLQHAARNLTISLINLVVLLVVFVPLIAGVASWSESENLGLLNQLNLSVVPSTILAILMLDAWMYVWHRANHRIPFLWRFHRVHHCDPEMDVTTATRFHLGEISISAVLRLMLIPILGVSLFQILLYDALLYPFIQFHHSNVYFPSRFDRVLRLVITSPAMHRVHHSPVQIETDSNYSSIFSFWDRIGRSFRIRSGDNRDAVFGLKGLSEDNQQRVSSLMLIPLK